MGKRKPAVNIEEMLNKWKSPFVRRKDIEEFTLGIYKASSLRCFDALDCGISPRYTLGGNIVFYLVKDVITWLKNRGNCNV